MNDGTLTKKKYKRMPIGYGMVQTSVMTMPGLSLGAKAVYALLASYTGSKEYCFPRKETMCQALGITDNTLSKYLKELLTKNLIEKSKLYKNPMLNHNKYYILLQEDVESDLNSHSPDIEKEIEREYEYAEQNPESQTYELYRHTDSQNLAPRSPKKKGIDPPNFGTSTPQNLVHVPPKIWYINNNNINNNNINNNKIKNDAENSVETSSQKHLDFLYIKNIFESKSTFTNFQKEAVCIKSIIKKLILIKATPEDFKKMVLIFYELIHSKEKYWKDLAFLPSMFTANFDQIYKRFLDMTKEDDDLTKINTFFLSNHENN